MTVNIVRDVDDWVRVQHVLVSVSDKQGLEVLVPGLVSVNQNMKIFSTGGLRRVSDYTGQPETQGGLVKTLDFKIYLGLLTETYNQAHQGDLERTGAVPIDMVVCNLYPFKQTIQKPDVTVEAARANIDIGGPCMVRASAKNYLRVASVTDPSDYQSIIKKLKQSGGRIDLKTRFALARKAFAHTAEYDGTISKFLAECPDAKMESCYDKKGA
jgi:phosphoribosylaminoimidazolecarboxamide formyltransferase/IMP cyclohydrolase